MILATIPQVTIVPIARGGGGKTRLGSRYFNYYTRPWITDDDFDARRDPSLTADEARAIDSAIDAYNETIIESVREARSGATIDWYLFDLGAALDRLAARRYSKTRPLAPPGGRRMNCHAGLADLDPATGHAVLSCRTDRSS